MSLGILPLVGILSSSILVQLDENVGASEADAGQLVSTLADEMAKVTRDSVSTTIAAEPSCSKGEDECLGELGARAGAEVVLVRVFGAITVLRVSLKRAGYPTQKLDLELDRATWRPLLTRAIRTLFPERAREDIAVMSRVDPVPPSEPTKDSQPAATVDWTSPRTREPVAAVGVPAVLPWVAFGVGALGLLAGGVVIGLAESKMSALTRQLGERDPGSGLIIGVTYEDADASRGSIRLERTVGWSMATLGIAGLTTGLVSLLAE
ncbi:MAG: hypothetical protein HY791_31525 [Deltaproteobacteria bacterium]|nr:hypothetical protein [Deltaproteobacteria bacterium]